MSGKETFMQKTVVVWLGAMLCCALWGSAFPCIKLGYAMFGIPSDAVGSQILFAGYRFTLAGVLARPCFGICQPRQIQGYYPPFFTGHL